MYEKQKKYAKTKHGLICQIYKGQRRSSEQRAHPYPSYNLYELRIWVYAQPNFNKLFEDWSKSGHKKALIPSCDRLDDYKPYALNNLQLSTWAENSEKGCTDRLTGKNRKQSKAVQQYTTEGVFIKKYHSIAEAARQTNSRKGNISLVCKGSRKTANNFIWEYAKANSTLPVQEEK